WPFVEVKPKEVEAVTPQVHHVGLPGMQGQLQSSQKPRDQIAYLLRRPAAPADHHEIVAVAIELADARVTITPPPIERMQVDVGQKRADHTALGNATASLVPLPVDQDPGSQPLVDQFQHTAIANPPPHEISEDLVIHIVEEALDVRIDDPPTADQCVLDRQHGLPRAPLGSVPIRARQEVRLEERLEDDLARLLDDPIANGRDAQWTRAPLRPRDLPPPHRLGG